MNPAVQWESVRCPLCGSGDEDELLTAPAHDAPGGPRYRVARCRHCGLTFQNPRPKPQTLGLLYTDDYKPYQPRRLREGAPSFKERLVRVVLARHLNYPAVPASWVERLLARLLWFWLRPSPDSQTSLPFVGAGRLLEVGCGAGWFAWRMKERGWKVTALDISPHVVETVRRTLGVEALVGTLPHPDLRPGSFDVVNMGSVLEHVPRPHEVVAAAARLLCPGGLLAVTVPNRDCWACRWFPGDWYGLDLPYHLLHFTPQTLSRLVSENGLEVCEVRHQARSGWMRRTLEAAGRHSRLARLLRLGPLPGLLTRWTAWTRQSDCLLLLARKPESAQVPLAA